MTDKPHLLLDWVLDIPNQILKCTINENLHYVAHKGGAEGVSKFYRSSVNQEFTETLLDQPSWFQEKFWISEHFGEKLGYFQPDYTRVINHPKENRPDDAPNGVDKNGYYIDHLQRSQSLLENDDVTKIWEDKRNGIIFYTPDGGKTILKSVPIPLENTFYNLSEVSDKRNFRPSHPQPCMMHPNSPGRLLSSYEDMEKCGVDKYYINQCKQGLIKLPKYPEIFYKHYIY